MGELVFYNDPRHISKLAQLVLSKYLVFTSYLQMFWTAAASLVHRLGLPSFTTSFSLVIVFLSTLSGAMLHHFGWDYKGFLAEKEDADVLLADAVFGALIICHFASALFLLRSGFTSRENPRTSLRSYPTLVPFFEHVKTRNRTTCVDDRLGPMWHFFWSSYARVTG